MGTQFFWIFDLSAIAIMFGIIFINAKKGFISVLFDFLALIAAFTAALIFSGFISEAVYDTIISKAVTEEVSSRINDVLDDGLIAQLKNVDMSKARINGKPISEIISRTENSGKVSYDLNRLDLTETGIENVDLSAFGVDSESVDFSSVNIGMVEYSLADTEKYGVYDLILSSVISENISEGSALGAITETVETIANTLPPFIKGTDTSDGGNIKIIEKITVTVLNITDSGNTSQQIADNLVRPVLLVPIRALIFVIIFVIILVIVKLLSKLFTMVNDIPIIGGLNKFFGGAAGFIEGAVIIFLVCIFVQVIIALTGNEIIFLNTMTIDKTFIFKHIYYFDFLDFMA